MARKRINESPTISDTIAFEIRCPTPDNCLPTEQPWKVSKVTIYHIKRDYLDHQVKGFQEEQYNQEKVAYAEKWEKEACANPSDFNIKQAQKARRDADASKISTLFFYNEAVPVKVFGTANYPPWLRGDPDNAILVPVEEDAEGATQYGVFDLDWEPTGQREGDYFICWTWEQDAGGDSYNQHIFFRIKADTIATTVIPAHQTDPEKYINLMERYLPEMYETTVSDTDLTPQVIQKLNLACAEHLTEIEDWANQLIDILDANVTNQSFLEILANFFNKKLRSDDPQLWRRQIKKAIPLYKKKGTLPALRDALQEAGIGLIKYTPLWQIISPYTWCEVHYVIEDAQTEFPLDRNPLLPITGASVNFELQIRGVNDDDWTDLTADYVTFTYNAEEGTTRMTWVGADLSMSPITLVEGDTLKVTYEINEVPDASRQTVEDYIRTLPLADQRDDKDQLYPLKNWNLRVIEDDDVMFDLVIPTRHPYSPDVIFGQVRTEFPFSENVYNMDEYNGSLRDSNDPCDIDKDFLDCCSACLSSKYNLDIQIQDLTDDRIIEALEIIEEYTPFHAVLHTLRFSGLIDEYINTNTEAVEVLLKYSHEEIISAGNIQRIFQRSMERESRNAQAGIADPTLLKRDALATMTSEATGSGTVSNREIVLYTPYVNLHRIGINNRVYNTDPSSYVAGSNSNLLEILSGSNAGDYVVSGEIVPHMVSIDAASPDTIPEAGSEPYLNETQFRFRLSNIQYNNATNNLTLSRWVAFTDDDVEFENTGIKTQWDVDNDPSYTGSPWQIKVGAATWDIQKIQPDGSLEFDVTSVEALVLDAMGDITYELLDDAAVTIESSTTGNADVHWRATIEVVDGSISDIREEQVKVNDYCLYGGTQYRISAFVEGESKKFYIEDYTGMPGSSSITIYRRLAEDIGYVGYRGMQLYVAATDLESSLGILNGENPPGIITDDDHMKENYLVLLYTGGAPGTAPDYGYYSIENIDGQYGGSHTLITLNGPKEEWTLTGQSMNYTIYRVARKAFSVPDQEEPASYGHDFEATPPVDGVNRSGADIISINTETSTPMSAYLSLLNSNDDQVVETIKQNEEITMQIKYKEEESND